MVMFNVLLAASLALQIAPAAATPVTVSPAPVPIAATLVQAARAPVAVPPEPSEVMAIPDELRNEFRTRVLDVTNIPEQRLRRMVAFMFDKDGLNLQYKGDTTNTVAESYQTREVNCLSFTLMAVALAREAGLKAHGQQINRVMAWSLIGDVVMQSLHANAVVTLKDRNLMVKDDRDFVLDIASSDVYTQDYIVSDYKIEDERLLASFYGNRAMELLAAGRLADSRIWLDMALKLNPEDAMLWNNTGVLSQRMGDAATAEHWFLRAAKQNPRLTSVVYNLVALYQSRGDSTRAAFWQARADTILRNDPYYQFSLAERNAQSGTYDGAIRYYRRAISLDGGAQLFHFGLARAYVKIGRLRDADRELVIAERLSSGADQQRYQTKLDALRRVAY